MKKIISLLLTFVWLNTYAQQIKISDGKWKGTLIIWKENKIMDSVPTELTIKTIIKDSIWQWKTEYISATMPVTKDYSLRVVDKQKGIYITDEGDGIELMNYTFGNKLYSNFETSGILLTSSYEWIGNDIIFEIASGKKIDNINSNAEVLNFTVRNLQKVVYKKVD